MEKISGIIPKNARNSNVDLSRSQPVRPGVPAFGRPVGKVTPRTFSENLETKPVEVSKDVFFIDNKKIAAPAAENEVIEDKIVLSPNIKELKKVKEEDDFENDVITTDKGDFQNQGATPQKTGTTSYNKKGQINRLPS